MSITNYPDADFTPNIPNSGANTGKQSYNPTGSFRFWAQKVLPTVYDDSLSYYEILTKVVNYLNAVIQNVDSLNDSVDNTNSAFDTLQGYVNDTKDTIISAYNELQSYVNTYFDSLDVQEEINAKLDGMASDGSLNSIVSPFIPSAVSDWLSNNITPTSPAIDASLSVSGAGADAKVTGDLITDIKEDFGDYKNNIKLVRNLVTEIIAGKVSNYNNSGVIINDDSNRAYVKIHVEGGKTYSCNQLFSGNFSFWAYENNEIEYGISKISSFETKYVITAPNNATILYLCNTGWDANTDIVVMETNKSIIGYSKTYYPFDLVIQTNIDNIGGTVIDEIDSDITGIYRNRNTIIGNIEITDSYWRIPANPGNTRVRNNPDDAYRLSAGDVIHLTNYDLVTMYIGYRDNDGEYHHAGWLQSDFIVPIDCECIINLRYVTETTVSSAEELSQYLTVYKKNALRSDVKTLETDIKTLETDIKTLETDFIVSTENVKSVNHQGYNTLAPNQTLEAYRLSKKYGFKYVECDVQKTSDGVYVLNHDDDISKTRIFYDVTGSIPTLVTNSVLISQTTYTELVTNYDMRKSLSDSYTGTKIAKFEDFILLCKNIGLHPYIEIKTGGSLDTLALCNIAKKYGMKDKVTWISTVHNYLQQVRNNDANARIGLVVNAINTEYISRLGNITGTGEKFMDVNYTGLADDAVNDCINANIQLEAWVVNDESILTSLNPYVSGVTSDSLLAGKVLYDSNIVT